MGISRRLQKKPVHSLLLPSGWRSEDRPSADPCPPAPAGHLAAKKVSSCPEAVACSMHGALVLKLRGLRWLGPESTSLCKVFVCAGFRV